MNWYAFTLMAFGLTIVVASGLGAQSHMRAMSVPGVEGRIVRRRHDRVFDDGSIRHDVCVTIRTETGALHHIDQSFYLASEADAWLDARPEGGRMRLQVDPEGARTAYEADRDDSSTVGATIGVILMLVGVWWATHP